MQFSLKPVFVGWSTLLAQLPLQLFLTFWAALFFGGITTALLGAFDGGDFNAGDFFTSSPFGIFGALAFFGVPFIALLGKKVNYARAEYRFFADHLELEEGFFSVNRKQVRYADIKEITLHKGFLQRMNGLGSIYLATLATGSAPGTAAFQAFGFGNMSGSGALIRDVAEPDEAYERIRRLVKPEAR
jgi:membrane protein YdbS with pleckstrin-like domain